MSKALDDFRDNILKINNVDDESTIRELVNLIIDATVEFVEENPEEFNLYTNQDIDDAKAEGEQSVVDCPSDYNLFSEGDLNDSYDNGVGNVLDTPSDYSLFDKDAIEELKAEWLAEYEAEESSKW